MTQNDENKLSMARNTMDVLNSNMAAVSTIEAFVTAKNRAAVLITEITEEEGKIKSNNTL